MASDFSSNVEEEKGLSHQGNSWKEREGGGIFSCLVLACSPPSPRCLSSGVTSLQCEPRPFPLSQIVLHSTIFAHKGPSIISALALNQYKHWQKFKTFFKGVSNCISVLRYKKVFTLLNYPLSSSLAEMTLQKFIEHLDWFQTKISGTYTLANSQKRVKQTFFSLPSLTWLQNLIFRYRKYFCRQL